MASLLEQDSVEFKKEEEELNHMEMKEEVNHTEEREVDLSPDSHAQKEVDLSPNSHVYQNHLLQNKWVMWYFKPYWGIH